MKRSDKIFLLAMLFTLVGVAFLLTSLTYKGLFMPGCANVLIGCTVMVLNILKTPEV